MNKRLTLLLCALIALKATAGILGVPDSVKLFAYTATENEGRKGLMLAWSPDDGKSWLSVGEGHAFITSDYGRWATQKRMFSPVLTRDDGGTWHCVWEVTPEGDVLAHASSPDLQKWQPQQFANAADGRFPYNKGDIQSILLDGVTVDGTMTRVPYREVEDLTRFADHRKFRQARYDERAEDDGTRFAGLGAVHADIRVDTGDVKPISDMLVGIFFEDINYGADGGLYAELVQNRDFEYSPADGSRIKGWGSDFAWSLGDGAALTVATDSPLHENNPHYVVLGDGMTLTNAGYDGIRLKKGDKYDFSLFARLPEGSKGGRIAVRLTGSGGEVIAKGSVSVSSRQWKRVSATLTAAADADAAVLSLDAAVSGQVHLDLISLFPKKTFRGRKNGLRADLAQTLAELHPKFVRFPGGCVAHGDGIDNIYDWKGSIGPLQGRKPMRNIWNYHQSRGLGYHEYFLFCEDIGAEPVPVLAAGVPCQNSDTPSHYTKDELTRAGQQTGIPMEDMPQYVQDVLDLIEYANGDARTSVWGRKRAEAGHPAPFGLKYIGIGNEDLISEVFKPRFRMIYEAVAEKYPEVTVIGTVGPFYEGSDYETGWAFASGLGVPMVDEHYYVSPGWFIYNQDYYDRYDRSKPKVYLGEYAAHLPQRRSCIETALAEALYLTAVERNADVVMMTSYAPLLANEKHTQWNPDLIYFNNHEIKPTVGYYTQMLFGQNSGDEYIASSVSLDNGRTEVKRRVGVSVVRDSASGDLIMKLVNLLPAEVNADICLPLADGGATAARTVLSGRPDDTQAKPVTDTVEVSGSTACTLPAYSLTVLRIKQ